MLRRIKTFIHRKIYDRRLQSALRGLDRTANAPLHSAPHRLLAPLYVSLTSYPPRFPVLYKTLSSLLRQDVKPDAVFLWISHSDRELLPKEVLALAEQQRIQLRYCEDLKSYKKIIPMLQEFPEAFIVTADDDHFYEVGWLGKLVDGFRGDYKVVVCHRAHVISLGGDGLPNHYLNWHWAVRCPQISHLVFPTGVGGVMYPPGVFHSDVLRSEIFMNLCPHADDLWLYWMVRLKKGMARKIGWGYKGFDWPSSQDSALFHKNVASDGNDRQIRNLISRYGFPDA